MTGEVVITVAICLILTIAGFSIRRQELDAVSRVRQRLEDQGLAVERLTPAPPNVVVTVNEQYGRSKYVRRRIYSALVNDAGISMKQVWMVENSRVVRIT